MSICVYTGDSVSYRSRLVFESSIRYQMTMALRHLAVTGRNTAGNRLLLGAARKYALQLYYSSDEKLGELEKKISGQIGGTQKSQIKFKPEKSMTQADWIGWLSQDINYDTVIDDYIAGRKMERLRQMQR